MKRIRALNFVLIFLIVIFVTLFGNKLSFSQSSQDYKMELWVSSPSNETFKIFECFSSVADFQCTKDYYNTTQTGPWQAQTRLFFQSQLLTTSPWKIAFITPGPGFTNFTFYGYINYFNIFWTTEYSDGKKQDIVVECYFNCDPRDLNDIAAYGQNCAKAQKCEPFPFRQPPGRGACAVVNPKYFITKSDKFICKVYDPKQPDFPTWY